MPGVVFVNPAAGSAPQADALAALFAPHRVEECEPDELGERVAAAVEAKVDFVGVAGGDGTIRTAAARLAGTGMPLLVVPAGTRNHFAKDVGVGTLDDAAEAAHGAHRTKVDIARVNGHVFVNNASIGLYPRLVREREARRDRLSKGLATVVAAWRQLRLGRKMWVTTDAGRRRVWMVFVGNGAYGEGLTDLVARDGLDDGLLDIRVVRAEGRWSRVRVVGAVAFRRLSRSTVVDTTSAPTVELDLDRRRVDVAVDGEIVVLEPPLRFTVDPGALEVLVPD